MKWKCRTLELEVFYHETETVDEMLDFISKFEKENNTSIRVCCAESGKRIIGGILQ